MASSNFGQRVRDLIHSGSAPQNVEQGDIDFYNELLGELASKKDAVRVAGIIEKVSSREVFEALSGGQPFDTWSFKRRLAALDLLSGSEKHDWLVKVLDELLDAQAASLFVEHEMKWGLTEGFFRVLRNNPTLASRIVKMLAPLPERLRRQARLALSEANYLDYALTRDEYQDARSPERVEKVLEGYENLVK